MDIEERQFILTVAWLFVRHGQTTRAKKLIGVLVDEDPRDGVSAVALAEILLSQGEAREALRVLRAADFPAELLRADAILETRALLALGKRKESKARWHRFLNSRKGNNRNWVADS